MKIVKFFGVLMLVMLIGGCSTLTETKSCPYVIGGKCVLADDTNSYTYAGVDFVFYNNASDKSVSDFTLVFYVYDDEGKSPFTPTNCIITDCKYSASPKTEIEGEVSLDEYLSEIPDTVYRLENIYVSEIRYADGSTWSDPLGFYAF